MSSSAVDISNNRRDSDALAEQQQRLLGQRASGFDIVGEKDYTRLDRTGSTVEEESVVANFTKQVMRNFRKIFIIITIPLTVILCILALVLYFTHTVNARAVGATIPGYCAFTSTILTAALIWSHLTVYTNPTEQRYIIRILILCPIYAIDSWIALIAYKEAVWVGLIRDCYEAYVIYMFFKLMIGYLGGVDSVIMLWREEQPTMTHPFPLCCLPPLKLTKGVMRVWQALLLQYVVLNPLLTIISVALVLTDNYEEGDFTPGSSWLWLSGLRFVSVTLAFTSLVYFYIGTKNFMLSDKPLGKFASVKIVVFLSFWQTVALAMLNHFHLIHSTRLWSSDDVATGLGNFLIAIEMYAVSVAHAWIFDERKYIPVEGRQSACQCWKFKHLFSIRDVIDDTRDRLLKPIAAMPVNVAAAAISATTSVLSPLGFGGKSDGVTSPRGFNEDPDAEHANNNTAPATTGGDSGTIRRKSSLENVAVNSASPPQSPTSVSPAARQSPVVLERQGTEMEQKEQPRASSSPHVPAVPAATAAEVDLLTKPQVATASKKEEEGTIERSDTERQWDNAVTAAASTKDDAFLAEAQKVAEDMKKQE